MITTPLHSKRLLLLHAQKPGNIHKASAIPGRVGTRVFQQGQVPTTSVNALLFHEGDGAKASLGCIRCGCCIRVNLIHLCWAKTLAVVSGSGKVNSSQQKGPALGVTQPQES